jgi:hypothetical protein
MKQVSTDKDLMSIENKAIQIKEHKDIRFDEDF